MRNLPICFHIFCRQEILTAQSNYILKLKEGAAPCISLDGWNTRISWGLEEGLVNIIDDTLQVRCQRTNH